MVAAISKFQSPQIDFGEVAPGASGLQTIVFDPVVNDAVITAQVTEGSPVFKVFMVTVFERVLEQIDPDELPKNFKPGPKGLPKVPVLTQVGASDGTTSLPIAKGQRVVIEVTASAPASEGSTDVFGGKLVIQGQDFETQILNLVMARGMTVATFDLSSISIPQGQEVEAPITVKRVAGADRDVTFSLNTRLELRGISMEGKTIRLKRGETQHVPLQFRVENRTALGRRDVSVKGVSNVLQLTVVPGIVDVIPLFREFTVQQGRSVELRVRIALPNPTNNTSVVFTGGNIPSFISMAPQTVDMIGDYVIGGLNPNLDPDGSRTVSIKLDVGTHAPATAALPLTVNYSAFNGQQSGSFQISIRINLVETSFFAPRLQASQVQCKYARLYCRSDGVWGFDASLHDFSDLFGDKFALGFGFRYQNGSGGFGHVITGELGASLTSPSENKVIRIGGTEPFIAQNWPDIFAHGAFFHLVAAPDFDQLVSDIGDDFKQLFTVELEEEDPPPEFPPPDGGQGGGEGGDE